jgi:hypothetical protein
MRGHEYDAYDEFAGDGYGREDTTDMLSERWL